MKKIILLALLALTLSACADVTKGVGYCLLDDTNMTTQPGFGDVTPLAADDTVHATGVTFGKYAEVRLIVDDKLVTGWVTADNLGVYYNKCAPKE